jgi:putative endonuclease
VECQEKSLLLSNRWYVYLLACSDGSHYTGVTVDLERRLRQHNGELAGGARYTRPRRPVHLVWSQDAESRSVAQRIEAALKQLSKAQKVRLVSANKAFVLADNLWKILER